jgi:hypothetical protein
LSGVLFLLNSGYTKLKTWKANNLQKQNLSNLLKIGVTTTNGEKHTLRDNWVICSSNGVTTQAQPLPPSAAYWQQEAKQASEILAAVLGV